MIFFLIVATATILKDERNLQPTVGLARCFLFQERLH